MQIYKRRDKTRLSPVMAKAPTFSVETGKRIEKGKQQIKERKKNQDCSQLREVRRFLGKSKGHVTRHGPLPDPPKHKRGIKIIIQKERILFKRSPKITRKRRYR